MRECASHTDECFESQGKVPSRRRLAPNRNLIVAGAAFEPLEVTPTLNKHLRLFSAPERPTYSM